MLQASPPAFSPMGGRQGPEMQGPAQSQCSRAVLGPGHVLTCRAAWLRAYHGRPLGPRAPHTTSPQQSCSSLSHPNTTRQVPRPTLCTFFSAPTPTCLPGTRGAEE